MNYNSSRESTFKFFIYSIWMICLSVMVCRCLGVFSCLSLFVDMESGSIPDSFRPQLLLSHLRYIDRGEYFCVARNSLGTDRSKPLFLDVTCKTFSHQIYIFYFYFFYLFIFFFRFSALVSSFSVFWLRRINLILVHRYYLLI